MAGGGVINALQGSKFFKGFMYGSILGGAGEPVKGVRFGALQSITISHEFGKAELRGPEQLPPLGVGITQENLTGTAEFASILAPQAKMLTGCDVSFDGTNTILNKNSNAEPKPFDLDLETPDTSTGAAADWKMTIYNCLAGTYQMIRADNRAWGMSNFGFSAYGRSVNGVPTLWREILPGNQTDSSTGWGTPLAVA